LHQEFEETRNIARYGEQVKDAPKRFWRITKFKITSHT